MLEGWVFGALVGTGDGRDGVHFTGVVGDGCAIDGKVGESTSLVGVLILADHVGCDGMIDIV